MSSSQEKIPMLDLPAQHAELDGELLARFSELLASGRFVLGAAVESFESDLARLCGQPHAIAPEETTTTWRPSFRSAASSDASERRRVSSSPPFLRESRGVKRLKVVRSDPTTLLPPRFGLVL